MARATATLLLFATMLLLFYQPATAQTCLKGDCKKGYGIQKLSSEYLTEYLVGNFNRKGKLEGKGYWLRAPLGSTFNEADLVSAFAEQSPAIEKLWQLKPIEVKTGNFVNGQLEGSGTMLTKQLGYFPALSLVSDYNYKKANLNYAKYEGTFLHSDIQKSGTVTFFFQQADTAVVITDNLFLNDNGKYEILADIRKKDRSGNQLMRGHFEYGKMHGWAIKSEPKPGTTENLFYRQLWFYGKLIHQDNGKAYPFDINDSKTIKDERDYEVTGPVIKGKVNGFGAIRKGNIYTYEGYITNNQPDGYGFLKAGGNEKYGLFKAGSFEPGTWFSYWGSFPVIEEGRSDNFKEGFVSKAIYENMQAYFDKKKPRQSWSGYKIGENGWQGKVVYSNFNATNEDWYDKGIIVSSSTSYNQLMAFQVYAKDGIASMVVSYDANTREGKLSDGRLINPGNKNEYRVSKHNTSEFYNVCICGGDGQGYMTAEVAGSTSSWTRTEQVNKSAVVGYWQGTQQVTSTYYTPGYTITRKVACNNPNAFWAPFGTTTRHSELTNKSLKE